MKAKISAKGYTNVILVLNMKRFVAAEDQERFESIRGTSQLAETLRNGWWNAKSAKTPFTRNIHDPKGEQTVHSMSTEQVGFATGVFRALFLEEHVVPSYLLKKEEITFPKDLMDNFQFRNLFLHTWNTWKIYIRPTVTGMFVIRLTREYNSPRELVKIAEDVLKLHESLDVQSARAWLAKKRQELKEEPEEIKKVERSVRAFLKWLGSKPSDKGELLYNPVQWKLAMEVASLFVKATGEITVSGAEPLHLTKPEPRLSMPLHDSYVVYHIDDIYADESIVIREGKLKQTTAKPVDSKLKENNPSRQIPVTPEALNRSPLIKRTLINLLEGAILERGSDDEMMGKSNLLLKFPLQRWQIVDRIMERNLASWMGEIFLLTTRTALIIPSRKYKG
ncbi:MAG TPA: hypothetical protein PLM89_02155, partial [Anaerolineales bacterium]|nr:hypothetical protein [Anaerolineales bacterium]